MKTSVEAQALALPPALVAEVEALAAEEHRPAADLPQDAVNGYIQVKHEAREPQRAWELGIYEDADDQPTTDEYREVIRDKIAQGARSLREDKFTDGPTFMARMDAELAELERQRH